MAKKPTLADLMAEIEALKREIAALKALPTNRVEHHWHHNPQPLIPQTILPPHFPPQQPWVAPWTITC